nr:hypothetical protein [Leptospira interrogans]
MAKRLNSLSSEVIDECCAAAMRYRTAFLKVIGKPDLPIAQKSDILKCIYPGTLIISNSNLSNDSPVIHLELNCEWEPEHGMEWFIAGDSVLYVGPFESVGLDSIPDDEWNFIQKK